VTTLPSSEPECIVTHNSEPAQSKEEAPVEAFPALESSGGGETELSRAIDVAHHVNELHNCSRTCCFF